VGKYVFQICLGHVNWNKFLNNRNEICFSVLSVFEQQKSNRTKPKPVNLNRFRFGFDFKFLKLIMSVWLIFSCKN
jgi:hypothetical protein